MIFLSACLTLPTVVSNKAIPIPSPHRVVSKIVAECAERTIERLEPETRLKCIRIDAAPECRLGVG